MSDDTSKRAVLFVASVSSFVTPFMLSATNVALPAIQAHFRMDAVLLAWVPASYLLATAVFLLPMGKLADIHGRKKVYVAGMSILTVASFFTAAAPSPVFLLCARVVQGVGSAMIFSTGVAIITSVFPVNERGKAIGITVSAVYAGLSVGPFIGGILTQYLTWRSVFGVIVPAGMATIYLAIRYLRGEWADARGERFDLVGSIVYGVAILLIMLGVSTLPSALGYWEIIGGIACFSVFVLWERRVSWPVFNLELFTTNRTFAFSSLAALINYSATFAVTFMLSLYLQYVKGLDPRSAGLVLVAQPLMMASFSPLAGRLSDRMEPQRVASLGMALTTLGLVGLTFLKSDTPLPLIIADLLLLGFGFALFSSPNMNAIMSSVEKKYYGIASSTVASMRLLGQMLSMGIATLMLSVHVGPVEITPDRYHKFLASVNGSFVVFAALCTLGVFASLARGRLRTE